jgi:hypothetical protein
VKVAPNRVKVGQNSAKPCSDKVKDAPYNAKPCSDSLKVAPNTLKVHLYRVKVASDRMQVPLNNGKVQNATQKSRPVGSGRATLSRSGSFKVGLFWRVCAICRKIGFEEMLARRAPRPHAGE